MSRTEPLSDLDESVLAAAEADLDRLLAIEPSAAFAARVRARIEADAPPHRWRWRGVALTAAAAAVLLVILTLGEFPGHDQAARISSPLPRHDDIVLNGPSAEIDRTFVRSTNRAARSTGLAHRQPHRAVEAEILIDPSVAEAIKRVMMSAGKTSLQTTAGGSFESGRDVTLPVPEPLDLPELVLTPADQSGGQQAVDLEKE